MVIHSIQGVCGPMQYEAVEKYNGTIWHFVIREKLDTNFSQIQQPLHIVVECNQMKWNL